MNAKRRAINANIFQNEFDATLSVLVKEREGLGVGILGTGSGILPYPVQGNALLLGSPFQVSGNARRCRDTLAALYYNEVFGVVFGDSLPNRRDKSRMFVTDDFYLEQRTSIKCCQQGR